MEQITKRARRALLHRRDVLRNVLRQDGGAAPKKGGSPRELREIEAALARIEAGQFGRCVECGGAIGRDRLRAVPEARHCIDCRSIEE